MSIPSNFVFLEQQIIAVDGDGSDTQAQFTVAPPAGQSGDDCFFYNDSAGNPCQVLVAATSALAGAVVVDSSAGGTKQFKIDKGVGILVKLNGNRWVGAICESGKTTTLYCHRGSGQ